MKRLFIAVPIKEQSRTEIIRGLLSNETVRRMPVRWTAIQNLHLTLQFLGDVEEKRIPVLKQIMNRCSIAAAESLQFTNIGAFPNPSAPRIIWLGIKKSDSLEKLQRQLTLDLIRNDFAADQKKFKAHLTLGRVKDNCSFSAENLSYLEKLKALTEISDSALDRVTLFESQLRPGGPIYTVLYEKYFA